MDGVSMTCEIVWARESRTARLSCGILRRNVDEHDEGFKASIIAGSERSDQERETLEKFNPDLRELELGTVIEHAMDAMGLTGTNKVFCNDILRVEASSPQQPHLTLVDLARSIPSRQ
jgi:hypothetical protein